MYTNDIVVLVAITRQVSAFTTLRILESFILLA